jgi:integrase
MAEDLVSYQRFLQDPQPPARWCLQAEPHELAPGVPNPAWRLFVSALSPSAARQALTILFGLFESLCAVGYLEGNPLRAARRPAVQRYLEPATWQFVLEHLETWPREQARYQRTRFLLSFLYLTGLRRSKIAQATTADLVQRRGQWWLQVCGKGGLALPVPIPEDALEVLGDYRVSTGRSAGPDPRHPQPLLMDLHGQGHALTSKAVHPIVTALFESAAAACADPALAAPHGRHQLNAGIPLLVVRDNLRHASVKTTERYLHVEPDRQHAQTQKHRLRGREFPMESRR